MRAVDPGTNGSHDHSRSAVVVTVHAVCTNAVGGPNLPQYPALANRLNKAQRLIYQMNAPTTLATVATSTRQVSTQNVANGEERMSLDSPDRVFDHRSLVTKLDKYDKVWCFRWIWRRIRLRPTIRS